MINIFQQQQDLESFSDQMLAREVQQPSGRYPQYLVASELQRRADLRRRFSQQNMPGPAPTVVEQRMAEMGGGIEQLSQGQMGTGNTPPPMSGGIGDMQQPQGYSRGGLVGADPDPDSFRRALMRSAGIAMDDGPGIGQFLSSRFGTRAARQRGYTPPPAATPPFNPEPFSPGPLDRSKIDLMLAVRDGEQQGFVPTQRATAEGFQRDLVERQLARQDAGTTTSDREDRVVNTSPFHSERLEAASALLEENQEAGNQAIADMQSLGEEEQKMLADMVAEFDKATAVERELARQVRSPEELQADRRRRALSGLGVAIGTAVQPGDVARSLGQSFNAIENLRETQRVQENEVRTRLATARDARTQTQQALQLQAIQSQRGMTEALQSMRNALTATGVEGAQRLAQAKADLMQVVNQGRFFDAQIRGMREGGMSPDLLGVLLREIREQYKLASDEQASYNAEDSMSGAQVAPDPTSALGQRQAELLETREMLGSLHNILTQVGISGLGIDRDEMMEIVGSRSGRGALPQHSVRGGN